MMQRHIQIMYNEAIRIAALVEAYHKQRPDVMKTYTSEAFGAWEREENAKLREAKMESMNTIKAAGTELIALIEQASIARGADLTDDAKLFNTPGLELTAADLEFLGEKYRENPSMSRLIHSYALSHNVAGAKLPKTAQQRIAAVEDIMEQIRGTYFSGQDTFGLMCRQLVDHWDSIFVTQMATIGDPK